MKRRYHERRELAIAVLGGKCARCDSVDGLEVDHIDRKKKTMPFSRMYGCGMSRFMKELKLCQLLCSRCHTEKTVKEDLGRELRKHGTFAMYRHGRRCDECRAASAAQSRKTRSKQRAAPLKGGT